MASLASCTSRGTLGSRFRPHVCIDRRDAFSAPNYVYVPPSRATPGSAAAQIQASAGPSLRRQQSSNRQQSSQVMCVAVSNGTPAGGFHEYISVEDEEAQTEEQISPLTPTSYEVQSLLMKLCDETSIAELKLKVGAFKLSVKREVGKSKVTSVTPQAIPPPVPSKPMVDSLLAEQNAPPSPNMSTTSSLQSMTSISKPLSSVFALLESAADEGLLFVKSPKVGFFRKGRVVKGKSSPPLCEEGQVIKEGHVVCYLEQLGTQQPVESDISGEVVKVLWDDGEPVGYGDPLIAIRPSFPGIKKLT